MSVLTENKTFFLFLYVWVNISFIFNFFKVDQQVFGMPNRDYFLKGRDDPTLLAYENYATQMAIMFGADPMTAKYDMKEMVDFEVRLANVSFRYLCRIPISV